MRDRWDDKIEEEQRTGKLVCECCRHELDPNRDRIAGATPIVLECPHCHEALDGNGWLWGTEPYPRDPDPLWDMDDRHERQK